MNSESFVVNLTTFDTSDNNTETVHYFGTGFKVLFATWLALIIVLSVIGNLFVILIILLDEKMRHVHHGTNLFLSSLAVSDMMTGLVNVPISLHTLIIEKWDLGEFMCNLNFFSNVVFLFSSVHCLMYISIHKYLSVKRLSECDQLPVSRRTCYLMILAAWVWGLLFATLTTTLLSHAKYKKKTTQCGPEYPVFDAPSIVMTLGNLFLNFIIPLVLMLVMYLKIYLVMRTSTVFRERSTARRNVQSNAHVAKSGDRAAINTLIIVLICFCVCWIPYIFYTMFVFFTQNRDELPAFINPLAYCFGFSNSACNPIIYAFRFPDFREGYKKIFRKICCRDTTGNNEIQLDMTNSKEEIKLTP